jgi:transcriptional regulator with XRE-family HTH domain
MNASERKAFGQRVRAERKARGWSQPELAERAELSTGTVSATERGLSFPQQDNLDRLLGVLGISLEDDGGDSDPEPSTEFAWGKWFEALPRDSRSTLYMIGLYLERLEPDDRDVRIREITRAIVEQRL